MIEHRTRCPLCGAPNLFILNSGLRCVRCHRDVVLRDASGGGVSATKALQVEDSGRRGLPLAGEAA